MCSAFRSCLSVYFDLSPRGIRFLLSCARTLCGKTATPGKGSLDWPEKSHCRLIATSQTSTIATLISDAAIARMISNCSNSVLVMAKPSAALPNNAAAQRTFQWDAGVTPLNWRQEQEGLTGVGIR